MNPQSQLAIAFAVGLAVGLLIGRYRRYRFQNRGEVILSQAVKRRFTPPDYVLLNHLTIPTAGGTTQIDHVLASRYGVFVIETKDYSGWIFAGAGQRQWTQVLYHARHRFQNPLRQNFGHLQAIRSLLDFLPPEAVTSAVVFTGNADFKTPPPPGVFTIDEFLDHVSRQTSAVMSINRLQFCVGRLETVRAEISKRTDIEHVAYLRRRHARED